MIEILIISPDDLGGVSEAWQSQMGTLSQEADQVMHGVHLVETAEGSREWELWADRALSFKGKGSWNVEKVRVVFFSDQGIEFRVTGDRGSIKIDSKDMLIEGNVVTQTSNDYLFYTDAMVYNSALRELTSEHDVKILGPRDKNRFRMELTGTGMLTDVKKSDMFVRKNVNGNRPLEGERMLKIRSNEAKMNGYSREVVFYGQVVMDVDAQTITGPVASLKYDRNQSDLKTIEFVGGVRVSDENKWAVSDRLTIFVPEKKLVLEGSPRVVQNNDEIQGDVIVFLNGGKQIQVLSGQAQLSNKRSEKEL